MATVTLYQERVNLGGDNGYKVINRIDAAMDIPRELFVYLAPDGLFSHVATLQDFAWPTANTPNVDFFRQDNAERVFPDVETALQFANHVKWRISELLKVYNEDFAAFAGSETTVITAP